jgi:prepilin-type N-terminal cleavage/methylation domain-containing protein
MRKMDSELRTPNSKLSEGFTLIEVLLALAIFSVILTVLYGSFFVSHRALKGSDAALLTLHELRTAMDRIQREVEAALPEKDGEYTFRVRDRDIFGRQASQLEFATHLSAAPGPSIVSYYVKQVDDRLVLLKRSAPAFGGRTGGRAAEMLDEVNSFTVEAYEGGMWLKTWQSEKLPEELRITISIPYMGKDLTLTKTIRPKIGKRA